MEVETGGRSEERRRGGAHRGWEGVGGGWGELFSGPKSECTKIARFLRSQDCDSHRNPEIAAISGTSQTKKRCDLKVRIAIASECDSMLRILGENSTHSAKVPYDLTLGWEIAAIAIWDFGSLSSYSKSIAEMGDMFSERSLGIGVAVLRAL